MTESLKVIFSKKPEDITEDDKKEIQLAVEAFQKETAEVCVKHGFEHKSVIQYTEAGALAALNIVPIQEQTTPETVA
jgi:hypothetical protein